MNTKSKSNRKRKSEVEEGIEEKKHRGPTQHMPPKPEERDKTMHWTNRLIKESNVNTKMPTTVLKMST